MPSDSRGWALARQVLYCQIGLGAGAALLALLLGGPMAAFAAFYGAMVAALPMLWMARKALTAQGKTPQEAVGGFYRGEVGKFGLTAAMFFIGVVLFSRHFLPLILSFMAAQLAYGAVLLMRKD